MSLFEEYLTLGKWLSEEQRLSIYRYLLSTQKCKYDQDYLNLKEESFLTTTFANGEILYSINLNKVTYKSRKLGTENYTSEIRTLSLGMSNSINRRKLHRFFAQAELDVMRNFPVPSTKENPEDGYSTNFYPFYDLNYYSNGSGKVLGLINKLKKRDDALYEKLLTS